MSVTGIALILFLTFHVLMNAVAIFSPEAYNKICGILGANWYAVAATMGLAALFVIHIIYAFWLTLQNRKARGNDAYEITTRPKSVEWASQNMLVLGIIIAVFTLLHLYQFWGHMMLAELLPCAANEIEPADGWGQIMYQFGGPCGWGVLVVYIIGFAALWFHMTHGFWSAFQTMGVNNSTWLPRLKATSNVWATCVCLLFAVEAVVFTLKAQCPECNSQPVPAFELKIMDNTDEPEMGAPCPEMGAPCPEMGAACPKMGKACPNCKKGEGAAPCPECQKNGGCPHHQGAPVPPQGDGSPVPPSGR